MARVRTDRGQEPDRDLGFHLGLPCELQDSKYLHHLLFYQGPGLYSVNQFAVGI